MDPRLRLEILFSYTVYGIFLVTAILVLLHISGVRKMDKDIFWALFVIFILDTGVIAIAVTKGFLQVSEATQPVNTAQVVANLSSAKASPQSAVGATPQTASSEQASGTHPGDATSLRQRLPALPVVQERTIKTFNVDVTSVYGQDDGRESTGEIAPPDHFQIDDSAQPPYSHQESCSLGKGGPTVADVSRVSDSIRFRLGAKHGPFFDQWRHSCHMQITVHYVGKIWNQ